MSSCPIAKVTTEGEQHPRRTEFRIKQSETIIMGRDKLSMGISKRTKDSEQTKHPKNETNKKDRLRNVIK